MASEIPPEIETFVTTKIFETREYAALQAQRALYAAIGLLGLLATIGGIFAWLNVEFTVAKLGGEEIKQHLERATEDARSIAELLSQFEQYRRISGSNENSECTAIDNLQICWESTTLRQNPGAPYAASFEFEFPLKFRSSPTVSIGLHTNSDGQAVALYNSYVEADRYSGDVQNVLVGRGPLSTSAANTYGISYIAIGEPAS